MQKKLIRLLSLMLAAILVVGTGLPVSVNAQGATAQQLKQQIRQVYSTARARYGRSFHGVCGTFVGYQLQILGITTGLDLKDGREGYDTYCNQTYSTGGYRVRAYPASDWTLLEALNHISEKGTKDVYNILVGFESTPSRAGSRYGHSCVIHGIVDGVVYFVDSFGVYLNGQRYREGDPMSCTIEEFDKFYKKITRQFDGVIHFDTPDYSDECTKYPTYFDATVLEATSVMSQPCEAAVDKNAGQLETLTGGQTLRICAVAENTVGEFWYQLEAGGYVKAQAVKVDSFICDDVQLVNAKTPTALRQGRSFALEGKIKTTGNGLYTVRARIFDLNDETQQVLTTSDMVEAKEYRLKNSRISKELTFSALAVGNYRLELAAVIGSYYYQDNRLQVQWETVSVLNTDFSVTEKKSDTYRIGFDPMGGSEVVQQLSIPDGEGVGTLPTTGREGLVFMGWYTHKTEGERITPGYQPAEDLTLYARWATVEELKSAAQRCWYVYADGLSAMGCAQVDGVLYYFTDTDPAGFGGSVWTAA